MADAPGAISPPGGVDPVSLGADGQSIDPREPVERLLRDLRTRRDGLPASEAKRRLLVWGPNELMRTSGRGWGRELVRQLTHPLAILLWGAAVLAALSGSPVLAVAIVAVVAVNAVFAFVQEQQAVRAIEALKAYLPAHANVRRDGHRIVIEAKDLVPGDVLLVAEGDRVSADARLISGSVELDSSALTGESLPVFRSAELTDTDVGFLEARDLLFSGTVCTGGEAEAVVFATGMRTELGRIAALSERVDTDESPLEQQVRRVAWLIAAVAVAVGLAFLPIGMLAAGLSFTDAAVFAVGLLTANVPEGLLPTITLALAVGVRVLARQGALVKRLSAVETLGSTTVICTDKTGTLTENKMRVTEVWTTAGVLDLVAMNGTVVVGSGSADGMDHDPAVAHIAQIVAACNSAELDERGPEAAAGDATEVALLLAAEALGAEVGVAERMAHRRRVFHFDPALKMMSTVDELTSDGSVWVNAKGAPEQLLPRCTHIEIGGEPRPLNAAEIEMVSKALAGFAASGLRVLGAARRPVNTQAVPDRRDEAERELCFVGLIAMFDPPRPEVAGAVARCHDAGIRVIVVTGDHGLTAAEIAHRVGIGAEIVVTGTQLDAMSDAELDRVLRSHRELIFARSSPEAKLRIADALRAQGEVVAMTGDGVNDAPALRRADIGVAMGRSGTDVAREAATMLLTDDNFATIVAAIAEGRRVYANVRKFIFYIFVHLTPELLPFLVFALSGGAVPLPLTVMAILAIDLGTETLPALALGREPAEPGQMEAPPRSRTEGVIRPWMLVRAWLFLGTLSAGAALGAFFLVLNRAGWHPGDDVGSGTPLHHAYLQATTTTFLVIVVCQIGTAFAARTEHASLRTIGLLTNPLLVWGVVFELGVAAAVTALPPLQTAFDTAVPAAWTLLLLIPLPVLIWGADEIARAVVRRRHAALVGHGDLRH